MDYQLQGKNAIVVASSQGLGKAIAAELLKEGANVLIVSRDEDKLATVQAELSEIAKGRIMYSRADVKNPADIKAMVEKAAAEFGGIDILVNNAGGPPAGSFEQMTDDDWQSSFELNLLSYIRTIRECLPHLKQHGGKIINIASSSIKEPIPGLILSNTFRTAIVGLSKTLADELAEYGILINTVAPGRIATDRVRHLDGVNAEKKGVSIEKVEEGMKERIPLGRYGKPEEFARVVTFLVSNANTYMTGSAFLVDGGMVKSI
ncbi:SDR family oxidoreductase [Peribacillus cavernae]|uniref:SDR family oxidoreductase n=1 Tax=Peribacillus cavernae TaxID=1674310 RepID=A0A433HPK9_9BACI|nr:SDR family oxidoreductase [Peribacillus cavernae]MDQ0217278.1 3-oxoacyl-[acyl-carrier protein] reductase [Peribacillus cavernae]RUQ30255.1 SDR family oxidoreductase [Peribacillus cavernae]